MHIVRWSGLFACVLSMSIVACGEDSNQQDGIQGAGGQPSVETFTPPTNGTPMNESDACLQLQDAFNKVGNQMGCTFTAAVCPGLIRTVGAPACSEYDQGTVDGCVAYYNKFTSCDDLRYKRCVVTAIDNSAPNGCPDMDAGSIDSGADASKDASEVTDSGPDASDGGGVDSGSQDASLLDGATDAPVESGDADMDAGG